MKYKEIEIIKEILKHLKPMRCLEWGTGYSTVYFPKYLNRYSKWISIENDRTWSTHIESINRNSNVEIYHIEPNSFPWTDKYKDGAYTDLKDYIEFPSRFGNFDFILIDGRARKDCLIKAYELIRNEGIVVLHDASRNYYHKSLKLYRYSVLFKDYCKDIGGLWVGSKGINIGKVLNINKHRVLWEFYNNIKKKL